MRKNLLLLSLLSLCLAPLAIAQPKPAAPACPDIDVTSPATVTVGEKITITCSVSGGDADVTPTYNWAITNGSIEEGQGTSTITINTEGVEAGITITATVDVGGYDRECSTSDSSSTEILPKEDDEQPAPEPQKPPR
jgi:hypothetical protein